MTFRCGFLFKKRLEQSPPSSAPMWTSAGLWPHSFSPDALALLLVLRPCPPPHPRPSPSPSSSFSPSSSSLSTSLFGHCGAQLAVVGFVRSPGVCCLVVVLSGIVLSWWLCCGGTLLRRSYCCGGGWVFVVMVRLSLW